MPRQHLQPLSARSPRVFARVVAGAAACVLALLGVAASEGSATAAPPAPRVGLCHNYGFKAFQRWSESSKAVSCRKFHTARTVAVGHLVKGTTWRSRFSSANFTRAESVCRKPAWRAIGGTMDKRDRSAYTYAWFGPTKRQFNAGARWIRCDVILPARARLLGLPKGSKRYLTGVALTDRTRRCYDGSSTIVTYSCVAPHSYAAVATFKVAGKTWPGDAKLRKAAAQRCPGLAGTDYWSSWSSRQRWKLGDHRIVCYAHD